MQRTVDCAVEISRDALVWSKRTPAVIALRTVAVDAAADTPPERTNESHLCSDIDASTFGGATTFEVS